MGAPKARKLPLFCFGAYSHGSYPSEGVQLRCSQRLPMSRLGGNIGVSGAIRLGFEPDWHQRLAAAMGVAVARKQQSGYITLAA